MRLAPRRSATASASPWWRCRLPPSCPALVASNSSAPAPSATIWISVPFSTSALAPECNVMRRIGIDVGGTNTYAVLLDGDRVVFTVKRPTTMDVTSGILDALQALRADPAARLPVDAVVIGTTHFINAVVQRRHLMKVAANRLGMPAPA